MELEFAYYETKFEVHFFFKNMPGTFLIIPLKEIGGVLDLNGAMELFEKINNNYFPVV